MNGFHKQTRYPGQLNKKIGWDCFTVCETYSIAPVLSPDPFQKCMKNIRVTNQTNALAATIVSWYQRGVILVIVQQYLNNNYASNNEPNKKKRNNNTSNNEQKGLWREVATF